VLLHVEPVQLVVLHLYNVTPAYAAGQSRGETTTEALA
jgi:hypothetical protein